MSHRHRTARKGNQFALSPALSPGERESGLQHSKTSRASLLRFHASPSLNFEMPFAAAFAMLRPAL
jgi:hypothetical protein